MIQLNHMSLKVPRLPGGCSTTSGPFDRFRTPMKYTVSALAVRNSDFASISSEKMTIVLSSAPMLWKPLPMA